MVLESFVCTRKNKYHLLDLLISTRLNLASEIKSAGTSYVYLRSTTKEKILYIPKCIYSSPLHARKSWPSNDALLCFCSLTWFEVHGASNWHRCAGTYVPCIVNHECQECEIWSQIKSFRYITVKIAAMAITWDSLISVLNYWNTWSAFLQAKINAFIVTYKPRPSFWPQI